MSPRRLSPTQGFHVAVTSKPPLLILELSGELDFSTVRGLPQPAQLTRRDVRSVLLDLSELTFCDVAGLRALLALRQAHVSQGRHFKAIRIPPRVRRVMDLCGIDDSLVVESTVVVDEDWPPPRCTDTVTVVPGPWRGVRMTTYPQEFKDQIVELHRRGRSFMDLGKEFNLAPTSISNWARAADKRDSAEPEPGEPRESDAAKIRRLEKELANRTEELEILGKALAFFARRMDR